MVKKYRKRPVVVDAMEFTLGTTTAGEILAFCPKANVGVPTTTLLPNGTWSTTLDSTDIRWIHIPTLEGYMEVSDGDYIIRGVAGEFYPCKPDIFAKSYDKVSDDEG